MSIASRAVRIPCGMALLDGDLAVPGGARGLVLFAHGSGSGRHSPRNRQVAASLQQRGLATLLFDLLTQQEEAVDLRTGEHRFDIPMLAARMVCATQWVLDDPALRPLPLGYFGASTGTAAALIAAAQLGSVVAAVVSRGGRPDLAGVPALGAVTAATLLLVGGADTEVIRLNEQAFSALRSIKGLEIVPRATHLFEEPGALEQVARLAGDWFLAQLARPRPAPA